MPAVRIRAAALCAACLPLVPLSAPAEADARVVPRASSGLQGFDQLNAVGGTLSYQRRAPGGRRGVARATYRGPGNGYSRGIFNVSWRNGERVRYGARFYLPRGFHRRMQGQVDILRWDTWPRDDRSGIVIYGSDRRARLVRQRLGVEQVDISRRFRLPEGRWFRLEVRQRLSRGRALNRVYLNGRLIAASRTRNTYGLTVRRVRYGIVAVDAGRQRKSLSLFFDDAFVRRG